MISWALSLLNEFRTGLYYVAAVVVPVLHLLLAVGVFRNGRGLAAQGRGPVLVSAGVWSVLTLVAGLPAFALYWAAHHSTLRGDPGPPRPAGPGAGNGAGRTPP
jgi:hypothetical protein